MASKMKGSGLKTEIDKITAMIDDALRGTDIKEIPEPIEAPAVPTNILSARRAAEHERRENRVFNGQPEAPARRRA